MHFKCACIFGWQREEVVMCNVTLYGVCLNEYIREYK